MKRISRFLILAAAALALLSCSRVETERSSPALWYKDLDGDGYSDGVTLSSVTRPEGYFSGELLTAISGDCDDLDSAFNPGAPELCNGLDDDCDPATRDDCPIPPLNMWHKDMDGDGWSDGSTLSSVAQPAGYFPLDELTAASGDCDDQNSAFFPGAAELCNGADDDCDPATPDGSGDSRIGTACNGPKVVLGERKSQIETFAGDKKLVLELSPFPPRSHDAAQVFNFGKVLTGGRVIKESDDDVAPYHVFGTTIGGNHGYRKTDCTAPGHGKGLADVGSVYTDGSAQWVICEVPDADTITVTARSSNTGFTGGTLTHLSGGVNTGSFTPSSVVQGQLHPVVKNRRLSIAVDGAALPVHYGTFPFQESVSFSESYEIMNKNSIVEWLITRAGTETGIWDYEGTADISVSMEYIFDASGGCTIYTDFQALNDIAVFTDIMFVMAYPFTPDVDGPVRYYVPKSLPFTHENVEYDLTALRDMTGFGITNRIDFTTDRCEPGGQLCDRLLMMNDSLGLALGYLPILDAAPGVRRTNASRKALQLSQLMKVYMSCIDGAKSSLTAGDYFSAVAYRNYFPRSDERSASYVVKTREGDYFYCDWHQAGTDRVPLPQNLQGRIYELVEKSSNVTILAASAPDFAEFEVTPEKNYGYAILYFPQIR